jgi:hypothetical protein
MAYPHLFLTFLLRVRWFLRLSRQTVIAEIHNTHNPMKTTLLFTRFFARSIAWLLLLSVLAMALQHCKKATDPAPDPYAFLKGTWRYANGAECLYDAATKTAKGTKVPTNNTAFKFVVGEDYWRNVLTTGTDAWSYDQIIRFSDGKTIEYRKSTMKKKDANTLSISTPGLTDYEFVRVP